MWKDDKSKPVIESSGEFKGGYLNQIIKELTNEESVGKLCRIIFFLGFCQPTKPHSQHFTRYQFPSYIYHYLPKLHNSLHCDAETDSEVCFKKKNCMMRITDTHHTTDTTFQKE